MDCPKRAYLDDTGVREVCLNTGGVSRPFIQIRFCVKFQYHTFYKVILSGIKIKKYLVL